MVLIYVNDLSGAATVIVEAKDDDLPGAQHECLSDGACNRTR